MKVQALFESGVSPSVIKSMASMYSDLAEGSSLGYEVDEEAIRAFFQGILDEAERGFPDDDDCFDDYDLSVAKVKDALSQPTCCADIMKELGL